MKKLALLTIIMLTTVMFSTASQAYRCAWRDGHRVCWHDNTNVYHVYPRSDSYRYVVYTRGADNCYTVGGHWDGIFYKSAHRVCR